MFGKRFDWFGRVETSGAADAGLPGDGIGQLNDRGYRRFRHIPRDRHRIAMMKPDGKNDGIRKPPSLGQKLADGCMLDAQMLLFDGTRALLCRFRFLDDPGKTLRHRLDKREFSEIVQKSRPVGQFQAHFRQCNLRDVPGAAGNGKAV